MSIPRFLFAFIAISLLLSSAANAQLLAFAASGDPLPAVVCNISTTNCTGTGGGNSLFTAATCDGNPAHDDAAAFASFNNWAVNTWQASHTGLIELDVPHGATCMFIGVGNCSNGSTCLGDGIKQFRVVGLGYSGLGDGATFSDNAVGRGLFLAAFKGVCFIGIGETSPPGCSARIATVSAGASCVTIVASDGLTVAQLAGRFTVGRYALVAGIDMQGFGQPPNPYFYEYQKITTVNSSTGVVCFSGSLAHGYKSTWPLYFAGNANNSDLGGPATIYALNAAWDTDQEYRGITFDQTDTQTYAIGRNITFRNVKFTGGNCGLPTQNQSWTVINGDFTNCNMEVDKINGTVTLNNVTIRQILFQSSSVDLFSIINSTITNTLNGAPKKLVAQNSTFANLAPGAYAYGFTTEVDCTSCTVTAALSGSGYSDVNVNHTYTMAGGIISIPVPVTVSAQNNNGSGLARLAVTSSAAWVTGQWVYVSALGGGACSADIPAAVYTVTVIDSTHVDLQGTTFSAGSVAAGCNMAPNQLQYPPTWAIPGANLYWSGQYTPSPPVFQVTDVTQDATFVYVHTTMAGGFPPAPQSSGNLSLNIYNGLSQTYTNSTAAGVAINVPAALPVGAYDQHTITGSNSGVIVGPFGTVASITFNVTSAYTGASSINFNLGVPSVIKSDGSTVVNWDPHINPKVAGTRVITPSGVTCNSSPGACSGDTGLTLPDAAGTWLVDHQITEEYSSVPGDIGSTSVTVTIQTNTGAVVP